MKKIVSKVFLIIVIIAVLINVLSIFNLSFFGIRVYRVASGSMEPHLKIGNTILIKKSSRFKVGDVVTYKSDNEYVTHRIVSIDKDQIITKGDANNTEDKPITKKDIVGKLIYKFWIFGFINYLLLQPFTWVLLFIVGLIITIFIPNPPPVKKKKGRRYYY